MKNATHDQVVTLLTANSLCNEIYLVVERTSQLSKESQKDESHSHVSLPSNEVIENGENSLMKSLGYSTTFGASLSKSLPSLVGPPPVPPPRDLKGHKRGAAPLTGGGGGRSMNNLMVAVDTTTVWLAYLLKLFCCIAFLLI